MGPVYPVFVPRAHSCCHFWKHDETRRRDEPTEQRVLNEILAAIIDQETNNTTTH